MARSNPRQIFGVNSATPYNRSTGLPYGELRIVKNSSVSLSAELVDNTGGASKYPWASEEGPISSEMALSVGEIPNFMFELFLGKAPTLNAAEASGNISTLTNKQGTSVQSGSNGIASVGLLTGSSANLKFGHYVVKAITASTFNVYLLTGIDIDRGTDSEHIDDSLLVASALGFTAGSVSSVALGLEFTEAGTAAFVVGDTATFKIRPVNSQSSTVRIGGLTDSFPEFGCLVYGQRRSNQEMVELDLFRCKAAGMPIPFETAAWAGFEVTAKILYDSAKNGVFDMTHVSP